MRRLPVAPGETIKEQMEEQNIDFDLLAAKLELTYEELGNLLEGDLSIDLDLAEKLEDVFDIEKDFWVNLQIIYDKALYDWYL